MSITAVAASSSTSAAASGTTSYSVTVPSSAVAGDLLIFQITITSGNITPNTPAGFTAQRSTVSGTTWGQHIYSKVLVAGDAGTTVAVSLPSGARGSTAAVLLKGTDGTLQLTTTQTNAAGTSVPGVAQTPPTTNDYVMEFVALRQVAANTTPASLNSDTTYTSKLVDQGSANTTTVNVTAAIFGFLDSSTSAVSAPTFTASQSVTSFVTGIIVQPQAVVVATPGVYKRVPGTVEFSVFTRPGSPTLPLKTLGLFDGTTVYPPHIYALTAATQPPAASPWSTVKYGYTLGDKGLAGATQAFGQGPVRVFGPATPAPLSSDYYDGRDIYYSFAGGGTHGTEMVSGSLNSAILTTLQAVPAGVNFVIIYSHEPEDNWPTTGSAPPAGSVASPNFQAAQSYFIKKVRELVANPANNIVGNIFTGIVFTAYHFDAISPAGLENWWPTDVEPDFVGMDIDGFPAGQTTYPDPIARIQTGSAFAKKHGIVWGVTELSHYPLDTDTDRSGRTAWLQSISSEIVANGGKVICLYDQSLNGSVAFTFANEVAAWRSLVTGSTVTPGQLNTFGPSGLNGGGFQNWMAVSPFTVPSGPEAGARPILLGADVAGVHRSIDDGQNWLPCNRVGSGTGLTTQVVFNHTAAGIWSEVTPGLCFVLCDNGLYRSTDFGHSWTKRGMNVTADGNGTYMIDKFEHPRPTGQLMALNADDSCLWVCSKKGVTLSHDQGATDTGVTALPNDYPRSIAWDPNSPSKVYVGVHNGGYTQAGGGTWNGPLGDSTRNGVWQITDADTTMAATSKLGTWPFSRGCEELSLDATGTATLLVAAAHDAGVASWTQAGGWVARNGGLDTGATANIAYEGVDTIRLSSGALAVVVGGAGLNNKSPSIARAGKYIYYIEVPSSGSWTWTCATLPANRTVSNVDFGHTDPSFISQIGYQDFTGGNTWVSACPVFHKDFPGRIYTAGRGGVWVGQKDTPSAGKWAWQVSTVGMMVTVNMFAERHPRLPGFVALGSMDYTCLTTADDGAHFKTTGAQAAGAPTTGDAGAFEALPLTGQPVGFALGASVRGSPTTSASNGVYVSDDITANPPVFRQLDLGTGVFRPGGVSKDVTGITMGRVAPGGAQLIIFLMNQVGFGRIQGTGAPTQITDLGTPTGSQPVAYFLWEPGAAVLYAHTQAGVFRSVGTAGTPLGADGSWTKIYAAVAPAYARYNTLAMDPSDTSKLYVSNGGSGVVRLNNAKTSTGVASTTVTTMTATGAGSIAMDTTVGALFAHIPGTGQLFKWATPGSSTASTDVSDQFFRDNGKSLRSITINGNGYLLGADNGQGCLVGKVR